MTAPFGDQQKLVLDHNMRVLVEQNAELRHCETLSIASFAVALTVVGLIVNNTHIRFTLDAGRDAMIGNYARLLNETFFAGSFFPLLLTGVFIVAVTAHLRSIASRAAERIGEVYRSFGFVVDPGHLVPLQDVSVRSTTVSLTIRRTLPTWLFNVGAVVVLGLAILALLVGLFSLFAR